MNNLKYLSLLILSVFLSSCSRGILVDGNLEQVYEEAKLAFPASSTYFLPNLNAAKLLLFEVSLPHEGHDGKTPNYIHLLMEYPKDKMDSILRIAYETSITYSFNDQYLLIWIMTLIKFDIFESQSYKGTLDINPIPNFDFLQNGIWGSKYQSEAIIYNLSWTQGMAPNKKMLRIDRAGLPKNWEHGSTAGVTIWDNYVAYWVDAW